VLRGLVLVLVFAACRNELDYGWDQRAVVCSTAVDDIAPHSAPWNNVDGLVAEAAHHNMVAMFHAHIPGTTVSRAAIDHLLSLADQYGLDYVTFADLVAPGQTPHPAIAFAFDDNAIDQWMTVRDILDAHHARVTFFVSRWNQQPQVAIDELAQLAADGHDLEPHSVNHLVAADYVAAHGLDAYMNDEVLPSLQIMIDAGYHPTTFAYPFGVHDDAIDRAVLQYVPRVRTTPGGCPRF
jgi:peptidoglycan/xylan/chitin deacetylase (PgdA/CDA1 family)